jgi:hypothetical protein
MNSEPEQANGSQSFTWGALPGSLKVAISLSLICLMCCGAAALFFSLDFFVTCVIIFGIAFYSGLASVTAYFVAICSPGSHKLLALVLGIISFLILSPTGFLSGNYVHPAMSCAGCYHNVKQLRKDLFDYVHTNNNKIPDANWCDVLKAQFKLDDRVLICTAAYAKRGQCSYALNKNLIGRKLSEVSADTVLLFETKGGWNQYGDANDIQLAHVDKTDVLFAGGKIRFIKEEDVPRLRWKP